MPVRTFTTRTPASAAASVALSQSATTCARKPPPCAAPLAQDFVSSVGTVITDGGGAHEHPRAINDFGGQPGQLAVPDPALVLSRLWPAVNLPAIGTPARCTMASVPARISGSGLPGPRLFGRARRGHGAPAG